MTNTQKDVLLVKNSNDNNAMKRLMKTFDPIIHKYALKIDPKHIEDATQDGYIGLYCACRAFNEDLGYAFSTFAFPYIHGAILRGTHGRRSVKFNSAQKLADLSSDENYLLLSNPLSLDEMNLDHTPSLASETDLDTPVVSQAITSRMDDLIDSYCATRHNSETFKEALRLRFGFEGGKRWKIDEICSALDVKKGTVKHHIARVMDVFENDDQLLELYKVSF
jgi:RNA polymerase sigma factor (sigma-70 family)